MNPIITNKKLITCILILFLPVAIMVTLPYGLTSEQGLVLSTVVFVVSLWATKIVDIKIPSIFLILIFLIAVGAPAQVVFKFPLSSTFVLLVTCTLIGEGIIKSKLSDRITNSFLKKHGTTGIKLVALPFIIDFILIFFIPQPFPRVILLSAIYIQFLKDKGVSKEASSVLLFSIFVASTGTSMFFLSGDILLNNLALEFAGVSLTWVQWSMHMTLPTLFICIILFLSFSMTFRKEIKSVRLDNNNLEKAPSKPFSLIEKRAAFILAIITILWMTEPLHGIHTAWISTFGVIAMLLLKLLGFEDIKKINTNLIIFLTAAFSIGGVLNYTGVAQVIYQQIMKHMPDQQSAIYFPFIILIVMALHMVIGSSITTLATVVPGIIMMNNGFVNPIAIALIAYTTVNIHYLLPFHHVTIMLGAGENYYDNKHIMKLGAFLTIVVFLSVLFIQLPWWSLMNLL